MLDGGRTEGRRRASDIKSNNPHLAGGEKLKTPHCARRFGAKHISKSKCTKHAILGPPLEVEMSKKCTPLWREAHFQVKSVKAPHVRTTFRSWDVEKVHAVVARSAFRSQTCKKLRVRTTFGGSDVVLRGRRTGLCTLSKVSTTWRLSASFHHNYKYKTLDYTTLHYTAPLHYTPLHYTKLYTTLHYTTLHFTTLHFTTLHPTTLYFTIHHPTLHCTSYSTPNYNIFHYATFRSTTLYCTRLHHTTLNYATLHYTDYS